MATTISDLIHKHIDNIWSETDPKKRRIAISEVYSEYCRVYDPFFEDVIVGHDALMGLIDEVQAKNPGFKFTIIPESIDEHHGQVRFNWFYGPPEEPSKITGQDFILVEDGKIISLTLFIDALSS